MHHLNIFSQDGKKYLKNKSIEENMFEAVEQCMKMIRMILKSELR